MLGSGEALSDVRVRIRVRYFFITGGLQVRIRDSSGVRISLRV